MANSSENELIRQAVIKANNTFANAMYKHLYIQSFFENVVIAPFPLHMLLGQLGVGARTPTREEIFSRLKYTEKPSMLVRSLPEVYCDLRGEIQKEGGPRTYTLAIANGLYVESGFRPRTVFSKIMARDLHLDFAVVDFSVEETRKNSALRINTWADTATDSRVTNILTEDHLEQASMVLTSAVYFTGLWEHQFDPCLNFYMDFYTGNMNPIDLDSNPIFVRTEMMCISRDFPYGTLPDLEAEAVAIPFRGGRLSLVIILPRDYDGLEKMEKNIEKLMMNGRSQISSRLVVSFEVDLDLPKFRISSTHENLREMMIAMGMTTMTHPEDAKFTDIAQNEESPERRTYPKPNLFISNIFQKVVIDIHEGINPNCQSGRRAKRSPVKTKGKHGLSVPFTVDRPFYFQIVDEKNDDLVLLSGHCVNPSSSYSASPISSTSSLSD